MKNDSLSFLLFLGFILGGSVWFLINFAKKFKTNRHFTHTPKGKPGRFFTPSVRSPFYQGLLGFILVIVGYDWINLNKSVVEAEWILKLSRAISQSTRIDVDFFENVLIGSIFLLSGLMLFTAAVRHIRLSENSVPPKVSPLRFPWRTGSSLSESDKYLLGGLPVLAAFLLVRIRGLQAGWSEYLAWGILIAGSTYLAIRADRAAGVHISLHLSRAESCGLLLLFSLGLWVSSFGLTQIPNSFVGDEGNFFMTAKDIAAGNHLPTIWGLGVYSFPIAGSYWQALFLKIFGSTLWAWRFSSVFVGMLALFPVYFLGRELFGKRTGWIAASLFPVLPYFLSFARLGYNNSQSILPVILCVCLFYLGMKNRSLSYILFSGFAAGAGFYSYSAGKIAVVIVFLYFILVLIAAALQRKFKKLFFTHFLVGATFLISFLIIAAPHLIYAGTKDPIGINFKMLEGPFFIENAASPFFTPEEIYEINDGWTIGNSRYYYNPRIYAWLFQRGEARSFLSFIRGGLVGEHYITSPLAGGIGAVFFLLGMSILLYRFREKRSSLLLISFFSILTFLSALNTFPPRHQHMVPILPFVVLIIAVGINLFVEWAVQLAAPEYRGRFRAAATLILLTMLAVSGIYDYFVKMPEIYKPDIIQVMNWMELKNDGNDRYIYITYEHMDADWKPWVVGQITADKPFEVIDQADFLAGNRHLPAEGNFTVFFPAENIDKVISRVRQQIRTTITPTYIFNRDGAIWGGIIPHGTLIPPTGTNFMQEFSKAWAMPSIWLVLAGICLSLFFYFYPAKLKHSDFSLFLTQEEFLPEVAWQNKVRKPALAQPFFQGWHILRKDKIQPAVLSPQTASITQGAIETAQPEAGEDAPQDEQKKPSRFIELEIRLRVNLGSGEKVYPSWSKQKNKQTPYLRNVLGKLRNRHARASTMISFTAAPLARPNWFLFAAALAILAQILISLQVNIPGILCYSLAALILMIYLIRHPQDLAALLNPITLDRKPEYALLTVILAIAAFGRFDRLMDRPYGYEADGAKIAAHTFYHYFLNQPGEMSLHFDSQPTLFFMQYLSMLMGGISFQSTRILSALLGTVSVLLLYLTVKRTVNSFSAIIASFLYAVSFVALSAARQTHIETAVEFWVVLTYYLVAVAGHGKKVWQYLLAGLASMAGMLCFESFYMTPIVAMLYMIWNWKNDRDTYKQWGKSLAAYLLPFVFIMPMVIDYNKSRFDYHFEPFSSSIAHSAVATNAGVISALSFLWTSFLQSLGTLFSRITFPDSLLRWDGPMVNPIILPFLVIGLILSLAAIKKNRAFLFGFWFLLQYFSFGVLGAPYPRVFYAGVISVYALAAFGFCAVLLGISRSWKRENPNNFLWLWIPILFTVGTTDHSIFWNKLQDPDDRIKRRELSELIISAPSRADVLYLPYIPNDGDPIELETSVIDVSTAQAVGLERMDDYIQTIPLDTLLWNISSVPGKESVGILYDTTQEAHKLEREDTIRALLTCYPQAKISEGKFFDFITLNREGPKNCHSIPPIQLTQPGMNAEMRPGTPIEFSWEPISDPQIQYQLNIEQMNPAGIWIEAEKMDHQNGWHFDAQHASDYSGTGFLTDDWQSGAAVTNFYVNDPGEYPIWVRSFKRVQNDQQNYISIDGNTPLPFANGSEETFYRWQWENTGKVYLNSGYHLVNLTRTYGKDPHYQVFVDVILLTPQAGFDPNIESEWLPYQTIFGLPSQQNSLSFPEGLPMGDYRWYLTALNGNTLVSPTGEPGVKSAPNEFFVLP